MIDSDVPQEESFEHIEESMNKRRKRHIQECAMRRPYYGTSLDKELKDAKNRARAHRRGDD